VTTGNIMSLALYQIVSYDLSELITKRYSTSFSLAVHLLEKEQRKAIYALYGFVRVADEIVDTFHGHDKIFLLDKLTEDLKYAIAKGISTNPVLQAFADTIRRYNIDMSHIEAFLKSMRADISKNDYATEREMNEYIYGSADVVGLMCLQIFCDNNRTLYDELKAPAARLGSAFQKVNFLRDLRTDTAELKRSYFPEIENDILTEDGRKKIEESIAEDFMEAHKGISGLPGRSRLAVLLAYTYYLKLLRKIQKTPSEQLMQKRIRIPNAAKYLIIVKVFIRYKLKIN
jgi:phytoene/squalene synthetase